MIQSKINNESNHNAWYIRKSTKKVMRTHDTLEIFICDLATLSHFRHVTSKNSLVFARSQIKISNVACVFITVLLIFECLMRIHHFVCRFSSVSFVFITFCFDFPKKSSVSCVFNTFLWNSQKWKDLSCILLTFGSRWVQTTSGGFRWLQLPSGKIQIRSRQGSGRFRFRTGFKYISHSF